MIFFQYQWQLYNEACKFHASRDPVLSEIEYYLILLEHSAYKHLIKQLKFYFIQRKEFLYFS